MNYCSKQQCESFAPTPVYLEILVYYKYQQYSCNSVTYNEENPKAKLQI